VASDLERGLPLYLQAQEGFHLWKKSEKISNSLAYDGERMETTREAAEVVTKGLRWAALDAKGGGSGMR